jgi:hypothetical protein
MTSLRPFYLPRLLTCLVVGMLLSLTVFIPSGPDERKQNLYISTLGRTDDIERAIKSLGRNDIQVTHDAGGVYLTPFEGWIAVLVLGTLISAVGWAAMSFIHSIVCHALESKSGRAALSLIDSLFRPSVNRKAAK